MLSEPAVVLAFKSGAGVGAKLSPLAAHAVSMRIAMIKTLIFFIFFYLLAVFDEWKKQKFQINM